MRLDPLLRKIRFDEVLVIIEAEAKLDEHDIIWDIKDQKVNVTNKKLLHNNANYQKLIGDNRKRRKGEDSSDPL